MSADIRLETDGEYDTDEDTPLNRTYNYASKQALRFAILEWHPEFRERCNAARKVIVSNVPPIVPAAGKGAVTPPLSASSPIAMPSSVMLDIVGVDPMAALEVNDSYLQPSIGVPVNSLLDQSSTSSESGDSSSADLVCEPMDCLVTPGSTPASVDSIVPPLDVTDGVDDDLVRVSVLAIGGGTETMQVDTDGTTTAGATVLPFDRNDMTVDDVSLLVDLFYLPFEHGSRAVQLLTEFHWLKTNVRVVVAGDGDTDIEESSQRHVDALNDWLERSRCFLDRINGIARMVDRFCVIQNKAVLFDLFPYLWDMKTVFSIVSTIVEWLGGC